MRADAIDQGSVDYAVVQRTVRRGAPSDRRGRPACHRRKGDLHRLDMDRVALSHSASIKMSPGMRAAIAFASSGRASKLLPEAVSVKIVVQRSLFSARI
jgi:hypothetical protein